MLLNSQQVEAHLLTNDLGSKAQVGYDLTIKAVKKVKGGMVLKDKTIVDEYEEIPPTLTPTGKYVYHLMPGTYSITFDQGCSLPEDRTAFIRHRSSMLRCGASITSGVYDPGFEVDEMGGIMFVTQDIHIERGARVAQIIMFENTPAEVYNGQWQGQKDVK
jgi:dUTP pyrophosphatase